jgi:hypothetical protein
VVSAADPDGRNLGFLDPEPLLFHSSSSSVILTRLSGPRSRPTISQKIWQPRESNPGPLDQQPGTLTTRPKGRSNSNLYFDIYFATVLRKTALYGIFIFYVTKSHVHFL